MGLKQDPPNMRFARGRLLSLNERLAQATTTMEQRKLTSNYSPTIRFVYIRYKHAVQQYATRMDLQRSIDSPNPARQRLECHVPSLVLLLYNYQMVQHSCKQ